MITCPKLNKAQAPASNSVVELEEFHKLANKFLDFPGSPYGSIWMSATDVVEEGIWRDHYTGLEAGRDVLEAEVGGLRENTDLNCGLVE